VSVCAYNNMDSILVRCHSPVYGEIAEITNGSAQQFAKRNGMGYFDFLTVDDKPGPYMAKVDRMIELFDEKVVHRIVYADVDVVFNKGVNMPDWMKGPLCISSDPSGISTGFMVVTWQAYELLKTWASMGEASQYKTHSHDQASLVLMHEFLPWVRRLVSVIPEDVVSCPESRVSRGSLAHHFWANGFGKFPQWKEEMKRYAMEQV